MVDYIAGNKQS